MNEDELKTKIRLLELEKRIAELELENLKLQREIQRVCAQIDRERPKVVITEMGQPDVRWPRPGTIGQPYNWFNILTG